VIPAVATVPQTRTRAKRRRLLLALAVVLLAGGAAVGAYLIRRSRPPAVPPIATMGMDAEVVAAVEEARAAVTAQPDSAAAWGRLGMVLFAQRMSDDCPAVFAEAERLDPADARWPYFHGLALAFSDPEQSVRLLEKAAALAPDNAALKQRLAEQYLKMDRTDDAALLFREVLEQAPTNPRALLGQGLVSERRGQWQEALEPLRAAADHPTARRAARAALAEAYARLGDAKAAEAERRLAADLPADAPWTDPFLDQARTYRTGLQPRVLDALALGDQGRLDDALALIGEVLRDHPDSDDAHLTRAKLLIRARRSRDAEGELKRTLQLNDEVTDAHFLLGAITAERGDWEAAERGFQRAVELKPAYAVAHQNLGTCRLKLGKKPEAEESFRQAVRYQPELPVAQLELGALLLEAGKAKEATPHLEQAVRLDGHSERARGLLDEARARSSPDNKPGT
jgi:tetratricopeptide (TPR) repeat protein